MSQVMVLEGRCREGLGGCVVVRLLPRQVAQCGIIAADVLNYKPSATRGLSAERTVQAARAAGNGPVEHWRADGFELEVRNAEFWQQRTFRRGPSGPYDEPASWRKPRALSSLSSMSWTTISRRT